MKNISPFVFSFLILIPSLLFAKGWNKLNSPENMSKIGTKQYKMNYSFNRQSKDVKISLPDELLPWSDGYWATVDGGIAYQYIDGNVAGDGDPKKLPTKKEIFKMAKANKLKNASPATKLDVLNRDYKLTLTKSELKRTEELRKNREGNEWEGLCHGWAPGALNYPKQPNCVTLTNGDGVEIAFNRSDITALITYYQGEICPSDDNCMIGERCDNDKDTKAESYTDVNPASMHIVLTSLLSQKQGVVVDRTIDSQVWNQPVFAYNFSILEDSVATIRPDSAKGTVREVKVKGEIYWINEAGPQENPISSSDYKKYIKKTTVYYTLELDQNDTIVGGYWDKKSAKEHPDFLWMQEKGDLSKAKGMWKNLGKLYNESIK